MNGIEHNFPLPETEAHKLDEVKEEITGHPPSRRSETESQQLPWGTVLLCLAGGLALGLWLNSRD